MLRWGFRGGCTTLKRDTGFLNTIDLLQGYVVHIDQVALFRPFAAMAWFEGL